MYVVSEISTGSVISSHQSITDAERLLIRMNLMAERDWIRSRISKMQSRLQDLYDDRSSCPYVDSEIRNIHSECSYLESRLGVVRSILENKKSAGA